MLLLCSAYNTIVFFLPFPKASLDQHWYLLEPCDRLFSFSRGSEVFHNFCRLFYRCFGPTHVMECIFFVCVLNSCIALFAVDLLLGIFDSFCVTKRTKLVACFFVLQPRLLLQFAALTPSALSFFFFRLVSIHGN